MKWKQRIAVAAVLVAIMVILVCTGCTNWSYDRQTYDTDGDLTEHVHAGRGTVLMFESTDYVSVKAGDKSIEIGGRVLDPEKVSVITPYGTVGGGD